MRHIQRMNSTNYLVASGRVGLHVLSISRLLQDSLNTGWNQGLLCLRICIRTRTISLIITTWVPSSMNGYIIVLTIGHWNSNNCLCLLGSDMKSISCITYNRTTTWEVIICQFPKNSDSVTALIEKT